MTVFGWQALKRENHKTIEITAIPGNMPKIPPRAHLTALACNAPSVFKITHAAPNIAVAHRQERSSQCRKARSNQPVSKSMI